MLLQTRLSSLIHGHGFKGPQRFVSSNTTVNQRMPRGFGRTPPFGLFVKENYRHKEHTDPHNLMRAMRDRWNLMEDNAKKVYLDRSLTEFENKKVEFERLSVDEKEKYYNDATKRKERKKIMKEKRSVDAELQSDKQSPKILSYASSHKLPTAYNLYVKEHSSMFHKTESISPKEVMKTVASSWKSLSNEKRQRYIDQVKILAQENEPESKH